VNRSSSAFLSSNSFIIESLSISEETRAEKRVIRYFAGVISFIGLLSIPTNNPRGLPCEDVIGIPI